jgi:Flp pilus assembly protein TadD
MSAPAFLFSLFASLVLAGCAASPVHLDPANVDGRDGGGPTPTYPMLMRIGAAARSSGDLPNALGVYRRAAEMAPQDPAPLIAAGDVLLQMGNVNEAIVSFHAALVRPGDTHGAQVGLAKAFLKTGKPELALEPLSKALEDSPEDPKLLMLLGVTKDLAERHLEAQDLYRRGLTLAPADPALTLNLALSLALSGNYSTAIAVLQPLAMSAAGSPRERQTLALIYGLDGNTAEASRISAIDLDETSVQHNISYFQTLRGLSPEARNRAILSSSRSPSAPPTS